MKLAQRPRWMSGTGHFLLSILWGGSIFFTGVAIWELPPLTIVLARVTIAAALPLPLLLAHGGRLPANLAGWMPFFAMGVPTMSYRSRSSSAARPGSRAASLPC